MSHALGGYVIGSLVEVIVMCGRLARRAGQGPPA